MFSFSAIEIVELYDAIQRVGAMAPLLASPPIGDDSSGFGGLGGHAAQQIKARAATAQLNTEEYSYTSFIFTAYHTCWFCSNVPRACFRNPAPHSANKQHAHSPNSQCLVPKRVHSLPPRSTLHILHLTTTVLS
jgi:hypothetical protein